MCLRPSDHLRGDPRVLPSPPHPPVPAPGALAFVSGLGPLSARVPGSLFPAFGPSAPHPLGRLPLRLGEHATVPGVPRVGLQEDRAARGAPAAAPGAKPAPSAAGLAPPRRAHGAPGSGPGAPEVNAGRAPQLQATWRGRSRQRGPGSPASRGCSRQGQVWGAPASGKRFALQAEAQKCGARVGPGETLPLSRALPRFPRRAGAPLSQRNAVPV